MIVYNSRTGFTRRYAEWMAEEIGCECVPLKEAKSAALARCDWILYGSWVRAGTIQERGWLKAQLPRWPGKRVGVFAVGAMPAGEAADKVFAQSFTAEERARIHTFYLQGGLGDARMGWLDRALMAIFRRMLAGKKDLSDEDRAMLRMISQPFDASDRSAIAPVVRWVRED